MKRWTLTLFAFLLTALLLASPVLGEEEAASQNVITAVQETEEWASREPVSLWMNAWETIYQVTSQLVFVHVEAVSPNGEPLEDTFRVAWDLSFLESEDLEPGEYMVQGKILASDSYRFDDSVSPYVSFPILLLEGDPPPQVIVSLDDLSHRYAEAIPVGTDWADYFSSYFSASSWTSSIRCVTDTGINLYGSIVWEDPMPDTSVPGVIEVVGQVILPENTVLAEGVTLPIVTVPISIQAEPRLECWFVSYNLCFPWIGDTLEDVTVLVSTNGGPWQEEDFAYSTGTRINVNVSYLVDGCSYEILATWPEGETNVFRFTWDGTITTFEVGGDRDGGDSGGSPSGDVVQPPPTVELPDEPDGSVVPPDTPEDPVVGDTPEIPTVDETPEGEAPSDPPESGVPDSSDAQSPPPEASDAEDVPTAAPESSVEIPVEMVDEGTQTDPELEEAPDQSLSQDSFLEKDTQDYSLLSGARVLLMLEDTDQARFSKNGVTVTIPGDALKALSLQADSRFYIEITRPDARHISLVLTVDDVAVASLPGTVVMVPLEKAPAGNISLLDAGGSWVSDGIYDSTLGVATFSLSAPGIYEVHQPEPEAQQAGTSWLLPVLAGAAVLVAAGLAAWFFGRRRRR